VSAAAISPDLTRIAVKPAGARAAFVIPATGHAGQRVQLDEEPELRNYIQMQFSSDGSLLAAVTRPGFERKGYRLTVWQAETGTRLGSAQVDAAENEHPPEIAGFSPDANVVLLQTAAGTDYRGWAVRARSFDKMPAAASWKSPVKFRLGQVDLASGVVVQASGSRIELFRLSDGKPFCPPLSTAGAWKRAIVGEGASSLATMERRGEEYIVSAWVLRDGAFHRTGSAIRSNHSVMLWDITRDGAST
jgi:hypothetical protein